MLIPEIYCDGSSSRKSGFCGWAAVGHVGNSVIQLAGYEKGTNQRAELQAIKLGLLTVPPGSSIRIISDSQFAIKGCTEFRAAWEASGFKNYNNDPVCHTDLFRELHRLVDERTVEFIHVRGHRGDEGNEWADDLAGRARRYPAEPEKDDPEAEYALVLGLATELLGSIGLAREWLKAPHEVFFGNSPNQIFVSQGSKVLIDWLQMRLGRIAGSAF